MGIIGDVPGYSEGSAFPDRRAVHEAGIHRPLVAGICGTKKTGAESIVLNGGYVDDVDLWDEVIYTGHGGNDPGSKKQIAHQSWEDSGNAALVTSERTASPVRVVRGYKEPSGQGPKAGYRYDGLYLVTEHWEEVGKDGFRICRFRLNRVARGK